MSAPSVRSTLLLSSILLLTVATPSSAQVPLGAPLPVDSDVTIGELDNGLRYFIRQNARPEARAELRLIVNAGSVLEDDTQLGLAHLVEHMAFNGTEHFEKQEIIDYMESVGMAFGPSVNAFTSFDETVFMLQVPTDDADILATAFQILEDWAHLITFEPEEIDQERGVVIEEWRLGRGAGARIADRQLPIVFKDSRYSERLPIGKVEVLESFPHEELTRFYEEWYRPDLMAVVAVGDFDPAVVEELVRTHFSRLETPTTPVERPLFEIPDHEETLFAIASDPEASGAQVALLALQEPPTSGTVGDYRRSLVENLAGAMLNGRFQELAQQADPPFVFGGTGRGRMVRTRSAYQLVAVVPESGHIRGMTALLTEAERAARHGFTLGELERAKLDLLRGLERQFTERENQPSARFAGEYLSHFLQGAPIPGISFNYQAAQALAPGITLEETHVVARANLEPANRVIMVSGIDKEGVEIPTEEALAELMAAVTTADIAPYEDTALDQPLVAEPPAPGSVVAEETIDELGVTVWTLSNGATVWLKPTDFKDDEIVLRATSPGGWSRSSLEDHESASLATALVQQGGVGDFSMIDLQKALAGKAAAVSPLIGETSEGLSGGGSPKDVEALLQLAWLYFTAPREDSTAFLALRSQLGAVLENRGASPMAAFGDTLSVTLTQGHPRALPPTPAMLDRIDLGRAVAFYRDRFASASDFSFVFVGALDLEVMRPLVERYLAALPASDRDDAWVDLDIDPPEGVVEKVVRKGLEPQSRTRITFTGPFEYTAENRVAMRALAGALELRLRERLREDLGGTYSVSANGSYDNIPEERYTFLIDFGSDPERAEELRAAVFEEIDRMKTEGPSEEDVVKVLEGERRSLETNMESNNWWAAQLTFSIEGEADPRFLIDPTRYDGVTVESIRMDANRYLSSERYVVVTLLPEGGQTGN